VRLALQQRNHDYQEFYPAAGTDLEAPTNRFDILIDVYQKLFARCHRPALMVTRMHLLAMELVPTAGAQRGLFDPPDEPSSTLAATKSRINQEINRFALRSGATLPIKDWYDDPALGVEAVAPQRTVY
jgi:hypothetical protein